MKLLQFTTEEDPEIRAGYLDGDNVVDINKETPCLPSTVLEIIQRDLLDDLKLSQIKCTCSGPCDPVEKSKAGKAPVVDPTTLPLSSVKLMAPVTGMDKVLCIDMNFLDYCKEQKLEASKVPIIFNKFPSTVVGPSEPVRVRTEVTEQVDWEVELAIVVGKTASCVKAENAYEYIFGYTIAQDISARDWQKEKNMGQYLLGKSMDTFCPLGPWIVTKDEIEDPQKLDISCSVNGVEKQKGNTSEFLHKIPDVFERITSVMTLLPGDVILTGTPGGVGMNRKPPEYLKPGDLLENIIQDIGTLQVTIADFNEPLEPANEPEVGPEIEEPQKGVCPRSLAAKKMAEK